MSGIDSYAKSVLHLDSNVTDDGSSPKTWTNNGSTTFAAAKFGNGAVFDGDWQKNISTPYSSDFDFGTGDFSVDHWFTMSLVSDPSADALFTFVSTNPTASSGYTFGYIIPGPSPSAYASKFTVFSSDQTIFSSNLQSLTQDQLYHFELTRSGNTLYFFLDGTQIGTASVTGKSFNADSNKVRLGAQVANDNSAGTYALKGKLDEVRFSNGVARHTSNFTPETVAYSAAPPPVAISGDFSISKATQAGLRIPMVVDMDVVLALDPIVGDGYFDVIGNLRDCTFQWQHSSGAVEHCKFENDGSDNFYQKEFVRFEATSHEGTWTLIKITVMDQDDLYLDVVGDNLPSGLDLTLSA